MSALHTEQSLSYSEPAQYSSKDFVEVQRVFSTGNPDYWYKSGSTFRISVANISQNEFVDTTRMCLEYGLVSLAADAAAGTVPADQCYPIASARDSAALLPGGPTWTVGGGVIGRATVSVPGLSLEQFLTSDGESQVIGAMRLLCASGEGDFPEETGPCDFTIKGRPALAGARGSVDRLKAFTCEDLRVWRGEIGIDAAGNPTLPSAIDGATTSVRGRVIDYVVPMSFLTPLANSASCRLPISFLAQGGDLMNVEVSLASASSALAQPPVAALMGAADYWVATPRLSMSVLQVNSPVVLAAIEALYRGVSSIPIAPGIDAPSVMVYKNLSYVVGYTDVNAATGAFQLPIPANQPSCRGLILKFVPTEITNAGIQSAQGVFAKGTAMSGSQWNGKYLFGPRPLLEGLQVRIGSFRVPLDAMSDSTVVGAPPGIGADPWGGLVGAGVNPVANAVAARHQARLYDSTKHLFSPFGNDEDPSLDALSKFHGGGGALPFDSVQSLFTQSLFTPTSGIGAVTAPLTATIISRMFSGSSVARGLDDVTSVSAVCDPCLYAFPFETASSAGMNHSEQAWSCRGLDLRNITTINVQGRITGVDVQGPPGDAALPNVPGVTGWRIYALMAYDSMSVILPGRIDLAAQFSLLPAGSTSVPSGGNPVA